MQKAMKIGLIDVDGHNYPNIPLMKISAWHKRHGDTVEWYEPMLSGRFDIVYMSKVFSFTPDYPYFVDADKVVKGGSGYAIRSRGGIEEYDRKLDSPLPDEIEHIYPDYSLYPEYTNDTAYGFLTRGCPRGCGFCHVRDKEGAQSRKVADLDEFWNGQGNIVLCDPNLTACNEWEELTLQLAESKAWIDINQGVDIRMMDETKCEMFKNLKIKLIHFAWDRYSDKSLILPKLKMFKEITGWPRQKMIVYVLTNYDTTLEQDLERIYILRDLGYTPDVRIYKKYETCSLDTCRKMQRWVNNRRIFGKVKNFEEYIG